MHSGRRGRRQDGLRPPYVVGRPGGRVGLQVEIQRQVHHDVGAAQLVRDGRVPYVQDVPLRRRALATPLVDGDDLLDLVGRGELLGEQRSDAVRGAGDRDDGPARRGTRGTG